MPLACLISLNYKQKKSSVFIRKQTQQQQQEISQSTQFLNFFIILIICIKFWMFVIFIKLSAKGNKLFFGFE